MSDTWLLAVDPGIRGCGVALFHNGRVAQAAYVPNPSIRGNGPVECLDVARAVLRWVPGSVRLSHLILEWPQIYRAGKIGNTDPNDLLPLAGINCALTALCAEGVFEVAYFDVKIFRYLPREWKGNIDADIMTDTIKTRLDKNETSRVQLKSKSLDHNIWDAVGLGLHHLGSLQPPRVIPR